MSNVLYRIGRSTARHPGRTLVIWLFVAVAVFGLSGSYGGHTNDSFRIPGVESQRAQDVLKARFPMQSGAQGQVVFHDARRALTDPANRAAIQHGLATLATKSHVVAVSDPFDARAP